MMLKGETRSRIASQKFPALERDDAIVLTVSLSYTQNISNIT